MRKMKKDERHTFIYNRAFELASSGKGIDWLSVEHLLRAEGWDEARSILDNGLTRKRLDDICKVAKSEQETENRNNFVEWINKFLKENISLIEQTYPKIKIYIRESSFYISTNAKRIELNKEFNSRKIIVNYVEIDGVTERTFKNWHVSKKPFDEFSIEDLFELVKLII